MPIWVWSETGGCVWYTWIWSTNVRARESPPANKLWIRSHQSTCPRAAVQAKQQMAFADGKPSNYVGLNPIRPVWTPTQHWAHLPPKPLCCRPRARDCESSRTPSPPPPPPPVSSPPDPREAKPPPLLRRRTERIRWRRGGRTSGGRATRAPPWRSPRARASCRYSRCGAPTSSR